jgi:hypothetical protein
MRLSTGRRLGGIGLSFLAFGISVLLLGAGWGSLLGIAVVVVFWILWRKKYGQADGFGGRSDSMTVGQTNSAAQVPSVPGRQSAPKTSTAALVEGPKLDNGSWAYDYCVVGESFYQATLREQASQGTDALTMLLIREPDNKYDKNAVAVYAPAGQIGHIPKEDAPSVVRELVRLEKKYKMPIAVYGRIGSGSDGVYGAFLCWPDKWD